MPRGGQRHQLLHQGYGMPNGMQKLTLMRHLPMQMQRVLIADGGLKTDSNIGSNGDGSSLEVPRTTDLWKADSAFIHWAMELKTQTEMHD